MPCLLLILSLYSIQNCYPLQTGTLQGFESSCPLLKKDFGKNYCPCPLLKKQLLQKYSSCLLLKKQIKNKYFSCLLFLTTTTLWVTNRQERSSSARDSSLRALCRAALSGLTAKFLTMCVTPSCVRSTIRGSFRPCDACGKAYKSMCMPIFRQKIVEIPLFSIANVQKQC